jgi:8-oxo-dGTP pyrophosphatase MutT (NUDIX family)
MKSTSPSPSEDGERSGPDEERAAGFVVFCGEGADRRYLLLRHRSEEYWAFPKGKIEPGEDSFAAAVREVFEETNIDGLQPIPGFREVSQYHFCRNGRTIAKRVAYFLGETSEDDVSLSAEHSDFRWLSFDEALSILTYDEGRRILREADRRLRLVDSERDEQDIS